MDRIYPSGEYTDKVHFARAKWAWIALARSPLGLILVILNINIKKKGVLDHNMDDKTMMLQEIAQELNLIRRVLEDLTNLMDRRTY